MPPEEAMASPPLGADLARQRSPKSQGKSPKQKSPGAKARGKGKGKKTIQAALEELDVELQRVLEISSISPSGQCTIHSSHFHVPKCIVKVVSYIGGKVCVARVGWAKRGDIVLNILKIL